MTVAYNATALFITYQSIWTQKGVKTMAHYNEVNGTKYWFSSHGIVYDLRCFDIDDIMVSALEGGVNYWCRNVSVVGDYLGRWASEQISRGGELLFFPFEDPYSTEDGKPYALNAEKFIHGIEKAFESEYFYNSAIDDGILDCGMIDAELADCIIQYALFGELIYG